MLIPVPLMTFGRCGSTFFMHLLAASSEIHFARAYPYEVRELTYLYRLARYGAGGLARPDDWNADRLIAPNPGVVGPYPFAVTEGSLFEDQGTASTSLFGGMWQAYSNHVTSRSPDKRYYAEKVPHDVVGAISRNFYTRNIFLLRDPRDELVSIREFNKKRGYLAFGWRDNESDIEYAARLCNMRRGFLDTCADFQGTERRILFKYEDLMADLDVQVTRLEAFLDVTLDRQLVMSPMPGAAEHSTSASPQSSVGRWRTELDESVSELIWSELEEPMQSLGYER